MNATGDKVFKAVNDVGNVLKDLSIEDQRTVMKGVAVLIGADRLALRGDSANPTDGSNLAEPVAVPAKAKQKSLVEFVKEKLPSSNAQIILTFASYRQQIEGHEFFAREELRPYFAKAKLPSPGMNFGRDFDKVLKEGWIHEDGEKSYVTQTGEIAIAAGFGGKGKPRGKAVSKK